MNSEETSHFSIKDLNYKTAKCFLEKRSVAGKVNFTA